MTNPNLTALQVAALDDYDLAALAKSLSPTGKLASTLLLVREEIAWRNDPSVVVEYYDPTGKLYHAQSAPTAQSAGHFVVDAIGNGTVMIPQGSTIHFRDARDPSHKRPVVLSDGERAAIRDAISIGLFFSPQFRAPQGISEDARRAFLDDLVAKLDP